MSKPDRNASLEPRENLMNKQNDCSLGKTSLRTLMSAIHEYRPTCTPDVPRVISSIIAKLLMKAGAFRDVALEVAGNYRSEWHVDIDKLLPEAWLQLVAAIRHCTLSLEKDIRLATSKWVIVARGGTMYELGIRVSPLISQDALPVPVVRVWTDPDKAPLASEVQYLKGRNAILLHGVVHTGETFNKDVEYLQKECGINIVQSVAIVISESLSPVTRKKIKALVCLPLDKSASSVSHVDSGSEFSKPTVSTPTDYLAKDELLQEQMDLLTRLRVRHPDEQSYVEWRPAHEVKGDIHYPYFIPSMKLLRHHQCREIIATRFSKWLLKVKRDLPDAIVCPFWKVDKSGKSKNRSAGAENDALFLKSFVSECIQKVGFPISVSIASVDSTGGTIESPELRGKRVLLVTSAASLGRLIASTTRALYGRGSRAVSAFTFLNRLHPVREKELQSSLDGRLEWQYELRAPAIVVSNKNQCNSCAFNERIKTLKASHHYQVRRFVEFYTILRQCGWHERPRQPELYQKRFDSLHAISEVDPYLVRYVVQHSYWTSLRDGSVGFDIPDLDKGLDSQLAKGSALIRNIVKGLPREALTSQRLQNRLGHYLEVQSSPREWLRVGTGLLANNFTEWVPIFLKWLGMLSEPLEPDLSKAQLGLSRRWDYVAFLLHEFLAPEESRHNRAVDVRLHARSCRNQDNGELLEVLLREILSPPTGPSHGEDSEPLPDHPSDASLELVSAESDF